MRVLLDANVIIRALLPSSNPHRSVDLIVDAALRQLFTILVPRELRREVLTRTSDKAYLASRIERTDVEGLVRLLEEAGERQSVLVGPHPPISRDPMDDYVLAYATAGRADILVTDDEDLLVLNGRFPFRIVRPPELLTLLREQGLA